MLLKIRYYNFRSIVDCHREVRSPSIEQYIQVTNENKNSNDSKNYGYKAYLYKSKKLSSQSPINLCGTSEYFDEFYA